MSKNVNNDVNVNPFIETVGATMTAPKKKNNNNKQTNKHGYICLPFLPGNFLTASYLLKICIPVKVPNANISF